MEAHTKWGAKDDMQSKPKQRIPTHETDNEKNRVTKWLT